MLYTSLFYKLDLGFSFGNFEDTSSNKFVQALSRRIGHLLINRQNQSNIVMNYLNQALIEDVIENNKLTTIFQNDCRSRSGKFIQPSSPDNMIKLLLQAFT